MKQRRTPYTPIFRRNKITGAINVGNTPPSQPADYDEVLLNDVGAIWYSTLGVTTPVVWPSLSATIAGNLASESDGLGHTWFNAWWQESGFAPTVYDDLPILTPMLWYSRFTDPQSVTWPDLAAVLAGNLGAETQLGHTWFNAWWQESGFAPATYDDAMPTGTVWFSNLDQQDDLDVWASGNVNVFDSGGFRYYVFTSGHGDFGVGTLGPSTIDRLIVGGGGGGGRGSGNPAQTHGGGGGGGEVVIDLGVPAPSYSHVVVGAGGARGSSANSAGSDGGTSSFMGVSAVGGGGGGAPNGAGRSGASGGGGGAGSVTAGGVGTVHNDGGAGATGSTNRGGGGGVAGPGGTGTAGAGIEWPAGSGNFYGAGGISTSSAPPPNSGSGGGGGGLPSTSFAGAAGTVIIRHPI